MEKKPPFPCAALLLLLLAAPTGLAAAPEENHQPPAPALSISRAAPPAAPEAVRAWYRRYRLGAAPVKQALARLVAARREHRPERWRPRVGAACRGLGEALEGFSRRAARDGLLPVPDRTADFHLRRGLGALSEAVTACGAGRHEAMELALARAARSLRQAGAALARYGVEP